ncbi:VTT domain-containing protein [Lyngbya aestuarii]|uniref:VTT domain-containing protein n=1 Tax=Lyngbya aestuarii TaxID=118322 RepID=UPI00403DBAF0
MEQILEWITSTVNSLGYLGIMLLMFLENIFPPLPSEIVMPLAGFTATQGSLKIYWVILTGTVGTVLGTLPWYYMGWRLPERRLKRLVDQYGKWLAISIEDIENVQKWFRKHGNKVVLFGRFVPGIRTLISLPAGFNRMNFGLFLFYTTLGSAIWVGALAYSGYLLGNNYQVVASYVGSASKFVWIILAVALIVWIVRRQGKK